MPQLLLTLRTNISQWIHPSQHSTGSSLERRRRKRKVQAQLNCLAGEIFGRHFYYHLPFRPFWRFIRFAADAAKVQEALSFIFWAFPPFFWLLYLHQSPFHMIAITTCLDYTSPGIKSTSQFEMFQYTFYQAFYISV